MPPCRMALPALMLFLGAACGSEDSPTTPAATGLSAAQTAEIGSVMQDEAETDVSAFLVAGAADPAFSVVAASAAPGVALSVSNAGSSAATLVSAPCAAPSITTDTDGDGVYNDATFTFSGPQCSLTNRRGGSAAIAGVLRIQDPTPTTPGLAYNSTLTALSFAFTGGSAARTYTVSRTGSRNVAVSGAGLSLESDLDIQRTSASGTGSVRKQWTAQFTPASGGTIARGQPLPAGALSATGSLSWTRGSDTFTMTLTTPVPLVYDATCTQPQRVSAGELRARGTFNGASGFVVVRWSACGVEPSVIFLPV